MCLYTQVWVSCSSVRLVQTPVSRSLKDDDDEDDDDEDYSLYTEEDYAELEHAFEDYWDVLNNNLEFFYETVSGLSKFAKDIPMTSKNKKQKRGKFFSNIVKCSWKKITLDDHTCWLHYIQLTATSKWQVKFSSVRLT